MTLSGVESAINPRKLPADPGSIYQSTEQERLLTPTPSVLTLPSKFVQGPGTIHKIAKYTQAIEAGRCAIISDKLCTSLFKDPIAESFSKYADEAPLWLDFNGESSFEEAERLCQLIDTQPCDTIIAVGGGKALDTGKLVRHYLPHTKLINVASIASTDAPATAITVVYSADHHMSLFFFLPESPDLVLVDTEVIANAPVRYFVAGMGDAISTYYEAKTCYDNADARSLCGARPTLSLMAWAELSRDLLLEHGLEAKRSIENKTVTDALAKSVEANILPSGTGAESGGIGVSHSFATAISNVKRIHDEFMHGEHVSVGLIIHLLVEREIDEAVRVAKFCESVGLPVCCDDIGWDFQNERCRDEVKQVFDFAFGMYVSNHKRNISRDMMWNAMVEANELKKDIRNY